jgi:DNA-binding IclR family transcriptional regulator
LASPNPAVQSAIRILRLLADRPQAEFTLSEVARELSINKATCLNILTALDDGGAVVKQPRSKRYALGPTLMTLGSATSKRYRIGDVVLPQVRALCAETGLAWEVTTVVGREIVILDAADNGSGFTHFAGGERVPLAPPMGLAHIAWGPAERAAAWLRAAEETLGADDAGGLRAAADLTRRRGFVVGLRSGLHEALTDEIRRLHDHDGPQGVAQVVERALRQASFRGYLLGEIDDNADYDVTFLSAPVLDRDGIATAAVNLSGFAGPVTGTEAVKLGNRLARSTEIS